MWIVLALMVCGVVLILAEFIVPGAVLGILGGLMLVASVALAWIWHPEHALWVTAGELVVLMLSILAGMFLLSRTSVAKFMILEDTQTAEAGYVAPGHQTSLLGKEGVVYSDLRPAGSVVIDNQRIMAVSDGSYIESGTRVKVIEVEGQRVVVETVEDEAGRPAVEGA